MKLLLAGLVIGALGVGYLAGRTGAFTASGAAPQTVQMSPQELVPLGPGPGRQGQGQQKGQQGQQSGQGQQPGQCILVFKNGQLYQLQPQQGRQGQPRQGQPQGQGGMPPGQGGQGRELIPIQPYSEPRPPGLPTPNTPVPNSPTAPAPPTLKL